MPGFFSYPGRLNCFVPQAQFPGDSYLKRIIFEETTPLLAFMSAPFRLNSFVPMHRSRRTSRNFPPTNGSPPAAGQQARASRVVLLGITRKAVT